MPLSPAEPTSDAVLVCLVPTPCVDPMSVLKSSDDSNGSRHLAPPWLIRGCVASVPNIFTLTFNSAISYGVVPQLIIYIYLPLSIQKHLRHKMGNMDNLHPSILRRHHLVLGEFRVPNLLSYPLAYG